MIVIAQVALYMILALYAYRTFISTRLPKNSINIIMANTKHPIQS